MENINIGTVENDGLGDKLRNAFSIVNENFQELTPNYKKLTLYTNYSENNVLINSPLIIGETYRMITLTEGDNFSNVGYVSGDFFVATGQYPISWTDSTIKLVDFNSTFFENTFSNVVLEPIKMGKATYIKISTEELLQYSNTFIDNRYIELENGYALLNSIGEIIEIKKYL